MSKENKYDKWLNDGLSESEITMLRRMKEKKNKPSFLSNCNYWRQM